MKKLIYASALLAGVAVLVACSSSPVSLKAASPVPDSRINAPHAWLSPCEDCGALVVKRDTFYGPQPLAHVAVNGKPVGKMKGGEKLALHLPPGDYVLSIQQSGMLNNPATDVTIRTGKTKIYRLSFSVNTFSLQPSLH